MDEHSGPERREQDQSHHDSPRPNQQSGRGRRPNQGRDQGNRASGGSNRSGGTEGGGGGRGQKRGGPPGNQQEGRDGRRRRKEGGDRRGVYGFGDDIERCTCLSYHHAIPDTWPVTARSNLATLRMIEVDRRPSAILFCDGAHLGPHLWPDGEIVGTTPFAPSEESDASHATAPAEDLAGADR